MSSELILVSHALCPYVQRAAIVLHEKGMAFELRDIDLARKPDWFLGISPLGKTPVLLAGGQAIFESAVICEYLDETSLPALHPGDPLQRGPSSRLDGVWIGGAEQHRRLLQRGRCGGTCGEGC